jgi:hypothetical protein
LIFAIVSIARLPARMKSAAEQQIKHRLQLASGYTRQRGTPVDPVAADLVLPMGNERTGDSVTRAV